MRMFITSKKKYLSNDMNIFGTFSIPLSFHFIVSASSNRYDVALMKLPYAIQLSDNVNTICLPDSNTNIQVGDQCTATGWGLDQTGCKIELTYMCI